RQQTGASPNISERLVGTKGQVSLNNRKGEIIGENPYTYEGPNVDPYVQEHANLINSIRNGGGLNEAEQVARSTLSAIAGRMAAYTGRSMKWEWALQRSALDLSPEKYEFGDLAVDPVAVPGKVKLI
ncbi:MAG: gfo/Idh/MocA family oxidoreductase, partial [Verrucomicrobiota bacterium]